MDADADGNLTYQELVDFLKANRDTTLASHFEQQLRGKSLEERKVSTHW